MLILTRKINEEIFISPRIRIKIISVSDNQVRLGISAPDDVEILRGELYDKIKEVNREAINSRTEYDKNAEGLKLNKKTGKNL
jgi:carbon storage regulator